MSDQETQRTPEYGFYSKVLNKPFDTLDELRAAEAEIKKAEEAKKRAAEARKADARKVEEAYKSLNAAKAAYNSGYTEARKVYLKLVTEAKNELDSSVKTLNASLDAAEKNYNDVLDEFTKAHPEGYHLTLKDGDNTKTISRSAYSDSDLITGLFNSIVNLF